MLINYKVGKHVFEKAPDAHDFEIIRRIEAVPLPLEVPTDEIPHMHMTHERARMDPAGVTHLHQFFLPRQAQALGLLWRKAQAEADPTLRRMLLFLVEQAICGMSVLNRYGHASSPRSTSTSPASTTFLPDLRGLALVRLDGKASRLGTVFRKWGRLPAG